MAVDADGRIDGGWPGSGYNAGDRADVCRQVSAADAGQHDFYGIPVEGGVRGAGDAADVPGGRLAEVKRARRCLRPQRGFQPVSHGRERWLRLLNSTSGAIASRRFKACAFCLAEKLRRSGSVTSGREANSLDWFRSERSARAVQSGPDSSGCLRNFSCASTGKEESAYSRWTRLSCLTLFESRYRN